MKSKARRWIKYLAAVVLGNVLYFALLPWLPPGARHHQLVDWGTFVDLWFCLFTYGLIELAVFLLQPHHGSRSR
ncbi:MAG: hypothetical protein ACRD10_08145 [Terriglobia bacterium]